MATTITNATLTVTITEAVSLNNKSYGNSNTLTIASINEVDQRILTIPTSEVTVVNYGTANAAGTFVRTAVKYLRITNKDDTNFVSIHITSASHNVWIKLEAGKSLMFGNADFNATSVNDYVVEGVWDPDYYSSFVYYNSIKAKAVSASIQLEYFVTSA